MAFLDDLSRKLTQVGQEAASQTKVFAETTRINAKISDEERQLNAMFMQLGRNYFDANKDDPTAAFADTINNIKDAIHRIEVYRGDIRRARGMVTCPNLRFGSVVECSVLQLLRQQDAGSGICSKRRYGTRCVRIFRRSGGSWQYNYEQQRSLFHSGFRRHIF